MCDRLCMTLSLKELQALIQLKNIGAKNGPNYVELGTKLQPIQTFNAPPNSPCSILLSEKHIYDGTSPKSSVLATMQWGLLPSCGAEMKTQLKYHRTVVRKDKLDKIEAFQILLKKGYRCMLVCEGFYQFMTLGYKLGKQAYYAHLKNIHDDQIKCEIVRPCYIAAVFDKSKQFDGRDLYSFTIITVKKPKHLIHRIGPNIPVIFNDIEQGLKWINFAEINTDEALSLLDTDFKYLEIDPVASYVFKKSNIGPECLTIVPDPIIKPKDDLGVKEIDGENEKQTYIMNESEQERQTNLDHQDLIKYPTMKYDENISQNISDEVFDRTTTCL